MRFRVTLAFLGFLIAGPSALCAGTITALPEPTIVQVDGVVVVLERAPLLLSGTFFVPLRGIFEALGARVTFQHDEIDAVTSAHSIVLHVAQPVAVLDGTQRTLAEPPVLIDGHAFVPLRFVATALDATVRYDAPAHTIFITRAPQVERAPAVVPPTETPPAAFPSQTPLPTPVPLPSGSIVLRLVREEPARGTTVARNRPEISASFAEPVEPASVHVLLDGREIASDAKISERSFVYEPPADLSPGAHEILVSGKTPLHEPFQDRWTFASSASKGRNYLTGVEPPSGITVTSPVVISGLTRPHAKIGMVATSSETASHFSQLSGGAIGAETTADDRGRFEIRIELADTGSGFVDVRIESKASDGGTAVRTLRLRL